MFRQAFLFLFISFIHLGSIGQNNLKESSQNSLLTKLGQELEASQHLTTLANYPEAYDKIWNALKVADSINNPRIKYQAYKNLSLLYSIF